MAGTLCPFFVDRCARVEQDARWPCDKLYEPAQHIDPQGKKSGACRSPSARAASWQARAPRGLAVGLSSASFNALQQVVAAPHGIDTFLQRHPCAPARGGIGTSACAHSASGPTGFHCAVAARDSTTHRGLTQIHRSNSEVRTWCRGEWRREEQARGGHTPECSR